MIEPGVARTVRPSESTDPRRVEPRLEVATSVPSRAASRGLRHRRRGGTPGPSTRTSVIPDPGLPTNVFRCELLVAVAVDFSVAFAWNRTGLPGESTSPPP